MSARRRLSAAGPGLLRKASQAEGDPHFDQQAPFSDVENDVGDQVAETILQDRPIELQDTLRRYDDHFVVEFGDHGRELQFEGLSQDIFGQRWALVSRPASQLSPCPA